MFINKERCNTNHGYEMLKFENPQVAKKITRKIPRVPGRSKEERPNTTRMPLQKEETKLPTPFQSVEKKRLILPIYSDLW